MNDSEYYVTLTLASGESITSQMEAPSKKMLHDVLHRLLTQRPHWEQFGDILAHTQAISAIQVTEIKRTKLKPLPHPSITEVAA